MRGNLNSSIIRNDDYDDDNQIMTEWRVDSLKRQARPLCWIAVTRQEKMNNIKRKAGKGVLCWRRPGGIQPIFVDISSSYTHTHTHKKNTHTRTSIEKKKTKEKSPKATEQRANIPAKAISQPPRSQRSGEKHRNEPHFQIDKRRKSCKTEEHLSNNKAVPNNKITTTTNNFFNIVCNKRNVGEWKKEWKKGETKKANLKRSRKEEFSTKMTMIIPEHTPPTTLSSTSFFVLFCFSFSLTVLHIYIRLDVVKKQVFSPLSFFVVFLSSCLFFSLHFLHFFSLLLLPFFFLFDYLFDYE